MIRPEITKLIMNILKLRINKSILVERKYKKKELQLKKQNSKESKQRG